ncbi:hypothetical protein [Geodermatophilus normandii]|uniref:EcsC family protein n=1 Tax=Geodermatophilus normandii TaxID=1137989 RepID=A0A6P0GEC7_9ACTN|nr:hypothetical protein [Geodermatophilus normandii]NEM05608.1 hypothetical protein [Geodermatophilus normandii]
MTEPTPESTQRIGAPRDVPPPRPVPPAAPGPDRSGDGPAWPADDSGLGRAARAVADAVSGLLSGGADEASAAGQSDPRRSAGGVLRDVLGALASAATSAATSAAAGSRGGDRPAGAADDERSGRNPVGVIGDLLATAAPRLPIRDAARLRAAYPGLSDEEIADTLVTRSSRLTAAVGAATGGLAAAHWFATPSLVALPLELGAETLLTAAVEVVMLGELHEIHGRPAAGTPAEKAAAYLSSWTQQRAVEGGERQGMGTVLGTAGFRALRRRLSRRIARSAPSAAPLLIGAALGGRGNLKATETLARRVRTDLRRGLS